MVFQRISDGFTHEHEGQQIEALNRLLYVKREVNLLLDHCLISLSTILSQAAIKRQEPTTTTHPTHYELLTRPKLDRKRSRSVDPLGDGEPEAEGPVAKKSRLEGDVAGTHFTSTLPLTAAPPEPRVHTTPHASETTKRTFSDALCTYSAAEEVAHDGCRGGCDDDVKCKSSSWNRTTSHQWDLRESTPGQSALHLYLDEEALEVEALLSLPCELEDSDAVCQ